MMTKEELDLLDREERIFNAFQAAIDIINAKGESPDPAKVRYLLDFLADEYQATRQTLMQRVRANSRRSADV